MAHLSEDMTDEEFQRRMEHKYAHRRIGREIWAAEQRRLTGLRRQAELRRIEAKFHNLGAAKEELTDPKHLDHLVPTPNSGGPGLPIAPRYAAWRPRLARRT